MPRHFNKSKPGKHRISSFSLSAVLIFLLVLLLVLSQFQPPKPDKLIQTEQTLTLSSISDFPIMGYASLTFSEGGGLYRLFDRQNLSSLQAGESYTLTGGVPSASRAKGGYRLPGYTAIIAMSSASGAVITTAADYDAESSAPLMSVLTAALAVTIVLFVLYFLFILLRALVRYIK